MLTPEILKALIDKDKEVTIYCEGEYLKVLFTMGHNNISSKEIPFVLSNTKPRHFLDGATCLERYSKGYLRSFRLDGINLEYFNNHCTYITDIIKIGDCK